MQWAGQSAWNPLSTMDEEVTAGAVEYNRRLERGKLLSFYHMARFKWLKARLAERPGQLRIIELGCFDGRALEQVDPARVERYVGIDANWGNGLDLARAKFKDWRNAAFIASADPSALGTFEDATFNIAISLETIEHIPVELVPTYLDELARITRGYVYISVPVEMGPVFLAKYLGKALLFGDNEAYGFREVVSATLWQPHRVRRREHKGFDYRHLLREIERRFDLLAVEGLPFTWLPTALSLTVAIVARSKTFS